jgi:glycosyltransferase involved in cell wall biosynthesis
MVEVVKSAPTSSRALITVGITCYLEGDWLSDCWNSVLAQTDDRWVAVLVMDGGASARTREIFDQLEHPKLKKIAMSQNVGPYPTRNKAFKLTETPYHFYLDGDDQLKPDAIATVLEEFARHPDAAFVYGDYECFGAYHEICRFPKEVRADNLATQQVTPGPCAYKVETWRRLGGFADELARGNADYDFLIGAFECGLRGYHCGRIFYRYRIGHSNKVSQSYNLTYHKTHEAMVRRHRRFFSNRRPRNFFLALGYRRAALANYAIGRLKVAAILAWAACRHGFWRDREMQIIILKGRLPSVLFGGLQRVWRAVNVREHRRSPH